MPGENWTVSEWNKWLEDQLRGKGLIGEVELREQELEWLSRRLRDELGSGRCDVKGLWRNYGWCAAAFSVAMFSHCWESEGHFWPAVGEKLGRGLTAGEQEAWRVWLEGFVSRNGFPTFYRVPGQRIIKLLRIHAVLPDDGAKRVFDRVVRHAVDKGLPIDNMTAAEVVEALDIGQHELRRPERDFLLYGDHVADDVLRRCVDLYLCRVAVADNEYRAAVADNEKETFGLPQRILGAFKKWWKELTEKRRGVWQRVSAPYLCLEPHGYVELVLPPREVARSASAAGVRVSSSQESSGAPELEKELSIDRHAGRTREGRVRLTLQPAEHYWVQYWCQGRGNEEQHVLGEMCRVKGMRDVEEVPWMAFSSRDGRAVASRVMPQGEVWVVCRSSVSVAGLLPGEDPEEQASWQQIDVLEAVELEEWTGYEAKLVDTTGFAAVLLRDGDIRGKAIPVDVVPALTISEVFGVTSDGVIVVNAPPRLEGAREGEYQAIVEWESPYRCLETWDSTKIEEALRDRAGRFTVTLRGRLGRSSRPETYVLVPGLHVKFSQSRYGPGNTEGTRAWVSSSHIARLESGDTKVRVSRKGDKFEVTGSPDSVDLSVIAMVGGEDVKINLPLRIEVPRVVCGLAGARPDADSLGTSKVVVDSREIRSGRDLWLWCELVPRRSGRMPASLMAQPSGWRLEGAARGPVVGFNLRAWDDSLRGVATNQELWLKVGGVSGIPEEAFQIGRIVLVPFLRRVSCEYASGRWLLRYRLEGPPVEVVFRLWCTVYPWLKCLTAAVSGRDGRVDITGLAGNLPPRCCLCEVVGSHSEEQDVLPDPSKGLMVELAPTIGVAKPPPGQFEERLRQVADYWAEVWSYQNGGWIFDYDSAMQAWQSLSQTEDFPRGEKEDLRKAVLLMLWWLKQAWAEGSSLSRCYARAGCVTLAGKLGGRDQVVPRLCEVAEEVKEEAASVTKGLCEELKDLI